MKHAEQIPPATAPPARAEAVVMGASAGAVEALSVILPSLPSDFRLPVMIVVHQPPDRPSALPDLFRKKCRLELVEVEDQEPLRPGVIHLAPPDYHLLVESRGQLALSSDEPVLYSRPSIDVLFESAADVFRSGLIGVVLTGGNSDGATGLHAVLSAGGTAVVQHPSTASMPAMPLAALKTCPTAVQLDLEQIGAYLADVGSSA